MLKDLIALLTLPLCLGAQASYAPHAQCNPLHDRLCLVRNRALSSTIFDTLTKASPHFVVGSTSDGIRFDPDRGLEMTITKASDQPTLWLKFYIMYGRVEIDMQAAPGTGVISSLYLKSDQLDRINIGETFGGNAYEYQTNFFVKGNTSGTERASLHQLGSSPIGLFHRYGIEWTSRGIKWLLDGRVIRTVCSNNSIPDAPMLLEMSLWAGGDAHNSKGTVLWLGGLTDYSKGPYKMYSKNLYVADYSTGREYMYGNIAGGKWMDKTSVGGRIHCGPAPRGRARPMTVNEQNRLPRAQTDRKRARDRQLLRPHNRTEGLYHRTIEIEMNVTSPHFQKKLLAGSYAFPTPFVYFGGRPETDTPRDRNRPEIFTQVKDEEVTLDRPLVQNTILQGKTETSRSGLSNSTIKITRRVPIYRRSWQILPANRIPFPIEILQRKHKASVSTNSGTIRQWPWGYWLFSFVGFFLM